MGQGAGREQGTPGLTDGPRPLLLGPCPYYSACGAPGISGVVLGALDVGTFLGFNPC